MSYKKERMTDTANDKQCKACVCQLMAFKMHNVRKHFAVILASLLLLAALFGCSPADLNEWVPAGMKKISNDMVDYNLYIPNDWTEDQSSGFITAYVSSADRTSINIISFDLKNPNQTLDEFWAERKESFSSFFTDITYETEGEATLMGGEAAKKYIYTAKASGDDYKFMQIITIKSGVVYIFTYTATAGKYDIHVGNAQKIIENFSFK